METHPTASTPPPFYKTSSAPGIFGTKIPASVAFAVGVLLFLMPLSELKCAGQRIASKSGLNYAMGKDWQPIGGKGFGGRGMNDGNKDLDFGKMKKGNTQVIVIAALGLGILGLLLSFGKTKGTYSGGVLSGILAAGAAIYLMIEEKKNFAAAMKLDALEKAEKGAGDLGLEGLGKTMNDAKLTLGFTIWYYVAVLAFLAAAYFCYKRIQTNKT
jgi:hypothetical protein